ncbi:4322_t:CDS:2 [Entrophospora sp. SA101]|nr:4322_t:CDS:2 [Entrophospora sp. SA101]
MIVVDDFNENKVPRFPESLVLTANGHDSYKQFDNAVNIECAKYVIKESLNKYDPKETPTNRKTN